MVRDWSAIILAGGKGTRLMPLTAQVPKPLVKVTNKPMIDYAIAHLIYADIKYIVIALAFMGEQIASHLKKTWTKEKLGGVELEWFIQDSRGTADAYRLLSDKFNSQNVVCSMADIVTNLPMKQFMQFHAEKATKKGIATVSMKPVESHTSQYGVVLLDSDQKIFLFLEKPGPMELYLSSMSQQRTDLYLHTNIINTGIYAFNKDIANVLNSTSLMDFGGEVFPYLLENEYNLYGYVKDYYWLDCGNAQTYKWANWDLLRKYGWPITPNGQEYDNVFVVGIISSKNEVLISKPTCFGENVQLENRVKIKELSSVGDSVSIGEDSIIDKSIIWDRVKIGAGCNIVESIICNDCEVGNNVVLERTTVGPNCKISSNSQLKDKTLDLGQKV